MLKQFLPPILNLRTSAIVSGYKRDLTIARTVGGGYVLMNLWSLDSRKVIYESEMLKFFCDSQGSFLALGYGWE